MRKSGVWLIATAAVLASAGVAQAQEGAPAAERTAVRGMPWYERFTTSNSVADTVTGAVETNDRLPAPSWSMNQRWGVTVDIREGQRLDRRLDGVRSEDEAAVGAYYQFTPRVRLGGEVSLGREDRDLAAPLTRRDEDQEPAAGVRIESAFRF